MDITRSVIALLIGMGALIVMIMKTKMHPSLALVLGTCIVGVFSGVELSAIPGLITGGFVSTLSSIGLVIAFGCMMGQVKKKSLTGLAIATACCLEITHASVPPTPGPLAVIAQFQGASNRYWCLHSFWNRDGYSACACHRSSFPHRRKEMVQDCR